jgi:hypothetical protein
MKRGVSAVGEVLESDVTAGPLAEVTLTLAEPDFVVSATLVAVTVTGFVLGIEPGAV